LLNFESLHVCDYCLLIEHAVGAAQIQNVYNCARLECTMTDSCTIQQS